MKQNQMGKESVGRKEEMKGGIAPLEPKTTGQKSDHSHLIDLNTGVHSMSLKGILSRKVCPGKEGERKMAVTCMLCGKEVEEAQGVPSLFEWTINGAVLGEQIDLKGHKICLENVNNLVVISNRQRFMGIMRIVDAMDQSGRKNIMNFLSRWELL